MSALTNLKILCLLLVLVSFSRGLTRNNTVLRLDTARRYGVMKAAAAQRNKTFPLQVTPEFATVGSTARTMAVLNSFKSTYWCGRICNLDDYLSRGWRLQFGFTTPKNTAQDPNLNKGIGFWKVYAPDKYNQALFVNYRFKPSEPGTYEFFKTITVDVTAGDLGPNGEFCVSVTALQTGEYNWKQLWTKDPVSNDGDIASAPNFATEGESGGNVYQFTLPSSSSLSVLNFETRTIHAHFCSPDASKVVEDTTFVAIGTDALSAMATYVCNFDDAKPDAVCDTTTVGKWAGSPDTSNSAFNIVQDDYTPVTTGDLVFGVVGWGGNDDEMNHFMYHVRSGYQ